MFYPYPYPRMVLSVVSMFGFCEYFCSECSRTACWGCFVFSLVGGGLPSCLQHLLTPDLWVVSQLEGLLPKKEKVKSAAAGSGNEGKAVRWPARRVTMAVFHRCGDHPQHSTLANKEQSPASRCCPTPPLFFTSLAQYCGVFPTVP